MIARVVLAVRSNVVPVVDTVIVDVEIQVVRDAVVVVVVDCLLYTSDAADD